jgi:hypothetical protein
MSTLKQNSPAENSLSTDEMRQYLSTTLSGGFNLNKSHGMLAEVKFRHYVAELGFDQRVSEGGWIFRNDTRWNNSFGQNTIVFFPETIQPGMEYSALRNLPVPARRLHTICATFHQIGIRSFFCAATIDKQNHKKIVKWKAIELGRPDDQPYISFPEDIAGFALRDKKYNWEKYKTSVDFLPEQAVPVEFAKESIRVACRTVLMGEISDLDGIFWGKERTYPVEIKEKTRAVGDSTGEYFGLDVGPFVKLAFYAARRGNLHSMFVVREIDDEKTRNLVNWWFITFEQLSQYASWVFQGGGKNMSGGRSATVKIPVNRFKKLDAAALAEL